MKLSIIVTISVTIFFLGCATYPRTNEDQATYHIDEARVAFSKNENINGVQHIDKALARPTAIPKVRELFHSYPAIRYYYLANFEKLIDKISAPNHAVTAYRRLLFLDSANLFQPAEVSSLYEKLEKVVTEGNIKGTIHFILGDDIGLFPSLDTPQHQQIIVNRSIRDFQSNGSGSRPIRALVEYVKKVGPDSEEGKRIESLLPTINIRSNEIGLIGTVFPEFANKRKDELTTHVFLYLKGGDRLLYEDLLQIFRSKIRGVEWVNVPKEKSIALIIERVRHDEKTIPERSQTISYSVGQVNFVGAILLMPRNSTYLYEVISGGTFIEYGYVVMAVKENNTIFDKLIRGKVGGEYRRCENERIQNVFGGVSPAKFVANDDMRQRCSGQNSISIDELRAEVLSIIAEEVLKIQPIKTTHDLN